MLFSVLSFARNATVHIAHGFAFLIAPPFCRHCRCWLMTRSIFCHDCDTLIKPITSHPISIGSNLVMVVFAISDYVAPLKSLILAKHQSEYLASRQLGELIWQKTPISELAFDIIVPIPLHWSRRMRRGYNQADVMANVIAKQSGKPVIHLLRRKRRTVFQTLLSRAGRAVNVAQAFALTDDTTYKKARILLVDDLTTTGATLRAAGSVLNKLKPQTLCAVVACRVV